MSPVPRPKDGAKSASRDSIREHPEYELIRADVMARLQAACSEMSPEAFDALVHEICSTKIRWGTPPRW